MKGKAVAVMWLALAAGCTDSSDARVLERAVSESPGADAAPAEAGKAWTARTPSGTTVRVLPEALPLLPGETRFQLVLEPPPDHNVDVSADLISPVMLAHGVQRFTARRVAPGRYQLVVHIPMEGSWRFYVNLGDGSDAAELALEVIPEEAEPSHGSSGTHTSIHPPHPNRSP
jgi:hypothetical protein